MRVKLPLGGHRCAVFLNSIALRSQGRPAGPGEMDFVEGTGEGVKEGCGGAHERGLLSNEVRGLQFFKYLISVSPNNQSIIQPPSSCFWVQKSS